MTSKSSQKSGSNASGGYQYSNESRGQRYLVETTKDVLKVKWGKTENKQMYKYVRWISTKIHCEMLLKSIQTYYNL